MRSLKLGVFHQTTPPGPIRGSLEPFLILATFKMTPRRPGHRGAANPRCPERRGVRNLRCQGHRGVVLKLRLKT